MHRSIRPLAVIIGVTALAVGSIAGPSFAASSDPARPVSAPTQFATSDADPRDYWTPQRMANAKPMVNMRERKKPRVTVSDETGTKARRVAGTDTTAEARIVKASEAQPAAVYPYPFGRHGVENPLRKLAPYRQVGRIFFRQNGNNYSCSGASVVGGDRHVVFTAGHCLNDGAGHWSTDVVFVPARREGKWKNPYGRFPAKELWVPSGWSDNSWDSYDLGAFNVGKSTKGKKLRRAVGALGFAYNDGRIQHWDIFGYPAQSPWKGNKLITCSTAHAIDDVNGNGPDTIGVGCDLNGGSSGGPWIVSLRRKNMLNGITTYGYFAQPNAVYGPYFDETANKVRCAAGTGDADASSC